MQSFCLNGMHPDQFIRLCFNLFIGIIFYVSLLLQKLIQTV